MDDERELSEIADFALRVARQAGELIMPYFRGVEAELKPDGTQVTVADRRAEELIRAEIGRTFPKAAILGEEFGGERRPSPGDQWIVDPIDGTAPFVLGLPTFGVLVALLRDGEPAVGVIHMPALGGTVHAARGSGCWYRADGEAPTRVMCNPVRSLDTAYVSAAGVHCSEIDPVAGAPSYRLAPLIASAARFRVVGDCVQHALVCRGRLDLAVDPVMSPWDSAALVPCVHEAGGVTSDMAGETDDVVFAGSLISAATEPLLRAALSCMRP